MLCICKDRSLTCLDHEQVDHPRLLCLLAAAAAGLLLPRPSGGVSPGEGPNLDMCRYCVDIVDIVKLL